MRLKSTRIDIDLVAEGLPALARPSPRGDLSGSLAIRILSLRALFPPPRACMLD